MLLVFPELRISLWISNVPPWIPINLLSFVSIINAPEDPGPAGQLCNINDLLVKFGLSIDSHALETSIWFVVLLYAIIRRVCEGYTLLILVLFV